MPDGNAGHVVVRVWMEPDDPQLRGRVFVDEEGREAARGVDQLAEVVRAELGAIEERLRRSA